MVSINPNIAQGFPFFDPMNMGSQGLNKLPHSAAPVQGQEGFAVGPIGTIPVTQRSSTMSFSEDPSKRIRKPYTITKSRENWTEQEHDKFLEALQLFDRDWKKIEAFVGSKTVIQIRSHAQKYFNKVQKSGTSEHVPPPRPKRKATHPYPQKAPKNVALVSTGPFPSSTTFLEPSYLYAPDSSSVLGNPVITAPPPPPPSPPCKYGLVQPVNMPHPVIKDELGVSAPIFSDNCCNNGSDIEDERRRWTSTEPDDKGSCESPERVMPNFAKVYSFIGSVFDPNSKDHLQKLKQMDPINLETVLLLMRNLSVNLVSPEFEEHRKLLSSYNAGAPK